MEAKSIVFINEKGGIGKTSTCFNLAWEIAKEKKVLLIDLDAQRANLTYFCGVKKTDDMLTMLDVLQSGKPVDEVIVPIKEGLDLIPADVKLSGLNSNTAKISRMKKLMDELDERYDYIFIDVNPSPNWTHVLALSSVAYCIILMLPDITSLEANMGIAESVEEVQCSTNSNLKVLGILFNKNDNRTNLSRAVSAKAETMAKGMNTRVFGTKIRNAVVLSENVLSHEGITDYDPKSAVAGDIMILIDEIKEALR